MKSFAFVTFLGLLTTALSAIPGATQQVPIIESLSIKVLPTNRGKDVNLGTVFLDRQNEEAVFAFNSSQSGSARTTETGIVVQRGTSGILRFRIRVKAVTADKLESSDSTFQETLNQSEMEEYTRIKQSHRGLRVSFLFFLGGNLDAGSVDREDFERTSETLTNYDQKSAAAREILESTAEENLEISGTLRAFGVSFIPTRVFSFIKFARIQLANGDTLTVISTDENDLVAADERGKTVPSSDGTITILPL